MREVKAGNSVASENEIAKRREMLYHRLCGVSACVNGPPRVARTFMSATILIAH
jgi:hypothetical protein